jgi:hypothetical protein
MKMRVATLTPNGWENQEFGIASFRAFRKEFARNGAAFRMVRRRRPSRRPKGIYDRVYVTTDKRYPAQVVQFTRAEP